MDFEAREANALRDLMVRGASSQAEGEAASTHALIQLIEEAGLAPFHARLEGMVAHANLWSVSAGGGDRRRRRDAATSFELASQGLGAK